MRIPSPVFASRRTLLHGARWGVPMCLAVVAACTGQVGSLSKGAPTGGGAAAGGGTAGGSGGGAGSGAGSGAGATGGGGTATGGGAAGGNGAADPGITMMTSAVVDMTVQQCAGKVTPGRAPTRRLTRFEYNNTVRDVLGDTTLPGNQLPSEVLASTFDLFGNNADSQPVSSSLAAAYSLQAGAIAARATATPAALAKLDPCAATLTPTTPAAAQTACARTMLASFAARAYRRAVASTEVDDLVALYQANATPAFAGGISAVIEGVLQSPDFLYRVEWGVPDPTNAGVLRPSGDEMATRLSYMLWGTSPDAVLRAASQAGMLATADGVSAQAARMLNDPKAHDVTTFFFDKVLPIESLTDLARSATLFPAFSPLIGSYMRTETETFLENEIFESGGGGTWKSILTAPYTYVNGPLAAYYGIPGVSGTAFVKTPIDPTQRKGLLTQGGVMTGTITTDTSNPVLRGSFVVNKILCRHISLPTDPAVLALVKVPVVTGTTARERFSSHSAAPLCHSCHQFLDPVGFALENFDAVGAYRTTDTGQTIDASGSLIGIPGTFQNALGMIDELASTDETYACFASHWLDFSLGRLTSPSGTNDDACVAARLDASFKSSGYNVKQLLIDLTQSDAFLYMPAVKE
jgi:Protein of unknown function (DUF1592)/Protein of unknown function (DUF1588)/Protein of unknown function (DUF1595)/Protein of unknown function (DUF1587)/Protein of unknown function (DUF1585)